MHPWWVAFRAFPRFWSNRSNQKGHDVPMARPPKYSRKRHRTIVDACRRGLPRSFAFRLSGIAESTGFEWLRLGRTQPDERPQYAKLERDVLQAEAAFVDELMGVILEEALARKPNSWLPAMTTLERRWPAFFGRRDELVIEGGEKPLELRGHQIILDPVARELHSALLRRLAGPKGLQPGERDAHERSDRELDEGES